ncbi:MAG: hypothetical protein ACRDSP_05945 [Pseudonocardiaceae bacterium]
MGSAVTGLAVLGALAAGAPQQPDQLGQRQLPVPVVGHVAPLAVRDAQPGWPAPPAGGRSLPPAQVDASALPEGYPHLVWTEGDGRTVGAYGQEGGCTVVHSELREQTATLVRMAFVEVTMRAGPCTMDLRFRPLTVALDAPLGQRTVVLERQSIGPPGR